MVMVISRSLLTLDWGGAYEAQASGCINPPPPQSLLCSPDFNECLSSLLGWKESCVSGTWIIRYYPFLFDPLTHLAFSFFQLLCNRSIYISIGLFFWTNNMYGKSVSFSVPRYMLTIEDKRHISTSPRNYYVAFKNYRSWAMNPAGTYA